MKTFIATSALAALFAFAGSVQAHDYGYGGYEYVAPSYQQTPPYYVQPQSHGQGGYWQYIPPQNVGCVHHPRIIPGRWVFVPTCQGGNFGHHDDFGHGHFDHDDHGHHGHDDHAWHHDHHDDHDDYGHDFHFGSFSIEW